MNKRSLPPWMVALAALLAVVMTSGASCGCRRKPEPASDASNMAAAQGKVAEQFSDEVLTDAFEKGRSLVIAEVLSVRRAQERGATSFYYCVKVTQLIVLGDCTAEDFHAPLELYAGASYGNALKQHSTYALFVTKDCPFLFSWCHRDDVVEVGSLDKGQLAALVQAASRAYNGTAIRVFREAAGHEQAVPPDLAANVASLCERFRADPRNRAAVAKAICASDLGSLPDDRDMFRSDRTYLPPRTRVTRAQAMALLGEPTLRCGRTYLWSCGPGAGSSEPGDSVGLLCAVFDGAGLAAVVRYEVDEARRWEAR